MASTDGGVTFTGVDLPLPPPRTNNGFDFGSDPGVAFDSNGNAYYSYIVVFFAKGGAINGTEMAVARSTDHGATLDGDVLRTTDRERAVQRQADDHRRHRQRRAPPPQPHLRRLGQRDRLVFVRQEREQRRPFAFRRRRRHVHRTRLGQRPRSRQDRRYRRRPVRRAGRHAARRLAGLRAQHDRRRRLDRRRADVRAAAHHRPRRRVRVRPAGPGAHAARSSIPPAERPPATLYCSYMDHTGSRTTVFVAKSVDGGSTWSSTPMPGTAGLTRSLT